MPHIAENTRGRGMKTTILTILLHMFLTFLHSTPFMLSQIIRQCSLFDVDISRELNRPIFNSKTRFFGQKREKRACFSKCFLFINFQSTPGFDKKLYDRGVTSE